VHLRDKRNREGARQRETLCIGFAGQWVVASRPIASCRRHHRRRRSLRVTRARCACVTCVCHRGSIYRIRQSTKADLSSSLGLPAPSQCRQCAPRAGCPLCLALYLLARERERGEGEDSCEARWEEMAVIKDQRILLHAMFRMNFSSLHPPILPSAAFSRDFSTTASTPSVSTERCEVCVRFN